MYPAIGQLISFTGYYGDDTTRTGILHAVNVKCGTVTIQAGAKPDGRPAYKSYKVASITRFHPPVVVS